MSNVRGAVAKRDEAAAANRGKPKVADVAKDAIAKQEQMLVAVLPRHVDERRFTQMVLQAMKQTPELLNCFATQQGGTSFLLAISQAAVVGLEPNTPTQECWILPRKNKGVQEAQLQIGYRGLLKLARRSGNIRTVYAQAVREHDHFVWSRGLEADTLEFEPGEGDETDRGDLTHAYAVARFTNGGYAFEVLDRLQVERRRASSDSWRAGGKSRENSPWTKWPEAMWRKSAIRALAPYLDLAPEAEAALAREDRTLAFDPETGAIDVETFNDAVAELPAAEDMPEPDTEPTTGAPDGQQTLPPDAA